MVGHSWNASGTKTAFDVAPDAEEILDYLMRHQAGPQKREVALANARSLDERGLAWLRSEMRQRVRAGQRAGMADTYNPWNSRD
jgi:hypothetical protein